MRLNSLTSLRLFCCTAISILILSSCYEPIEGCLDPFSSNFRLDADNDCEHCCTYPSVNLNLFHMWDSINLNQVNALDTITSDTVKLDRFRIDTIQLDSIQMDSFRFDTIQLDSIKFDTSRFFLTNELDQRLRIKHSQFLISNIYFSDMAGGIQSTQDSVIMSCDPPETLYNTVDIIFLGSRSTEIQNIVLNTAFKRVHFDIGISDCLASIDTIGLTSNISTLEKLNSVSISENEYISHQFTIEFIEDQARERSYIFTNSDALVSISLRNLIEEFTTARGNDLSIDIDVNYNEWFKDLKFSDTEELIKQKIKQNSETAFSLRN